MAKGRPPAAEAKVGKAIKGHLDKTIATYTMATEPIAAMVWQSLDNFAGAWGVDLTDDMRRELIKKMAMILRRKPTLNPTALLVESFAEACKNEIYSGILTKMSSFVGEEE